VQYSLLSRFQGALLGSFLGEALVSHSLTRVKFSIWSEIGIDLMESAIASGTLSPKDWENIYNRYQRALSSKNASNSGAIAAAILPVLLLFHENPNALQEQLQSLGELMGLSNETKEDVLIWGYAIALALREKLDICGAISQILSRYPNSQSPIIQELNQIRVFLQQNIPLKQAISQITCTDKSQPSPIVLAFYCTSGNWEDFSLCLMRAMHSGKQASLVTALTGALAGAYNSFSAIPIQWRVAISRSSTSQQLLKQTTQIAAIWSGVCCPNNADYIVSEAVSSPQVIQPRSSLKIISQGEYLSDPTLTIVDDKVIKK
jgi:ADP-ribosylglycohydrolase